MKRQTTVAHAEFTTMTKCAGRYRAAQVPPPSEGPRPCKGLFSAINVDLALHGLLLHEGTPVDAALIAAPSSTQSKERERDPEMHKAIRGSQWYFELGRVCKSRSELIEDGGEVNEVGEGFSEFVVVGWRCGVGF